MFFIILYSLLCFAEKQSNETFVSQTISANVQPCIVNYRATCSSHGNCLELQNGTTICFCDANFTGPFCETSTLPRSIFTSSSLTHTTATMQSTVGLPIYAIVLIVVLSVCVLCFIVGFFICCCGLTESLGRR